MNRFKSKIVFIFITLLFLTTCDKDDPSLNIFTINQDIEFGAQLQEEIENNPTDFPLLDESEYSLAYTHIERIRDAILQSDDLKYSTRFDWEIRIINNDTVLNAFAAPGGFMCFYTGLIKFLDNEAQLAGVMAHEIAHADRRHSTDRLTKAYGLELLVGILLGNQPGKIAEIAAGLAKGLANLSFSRENEYEADEYAVTYLYDTDYDPRGIAGFFEKLGNHSQIGRAHV